MTERPKVERKCSVCGTVKTLAAAKWIATVCASCNRKKNGIVLRQRAL
mgnify:CR=1 FL=1